jgi:hypothetical protein
MLVKEQKWGKRQPSYILKPPSRALDDHGPREVYTFSEQLSAAPTADFPTHHRSPTMTQMAGGQGIMAHASRGCRTFTTTYHSFCYYASLLRYKRSIQRGTATHAKNQQPTKTSATAPLRRGCCPGRKKKQWPAESQTHTAAKQRICRLKEKQEKKKKRR